MSLDKKTGLRIRRMQAADIDRVMAIANGLLHAPHWPRDAYEKAIASGRTPERVALIAEAGEEIAGFAIAGLVPPEAELETIAVQPGRQRQGIASRLFAELMAELKTRQITEVMLEVRESNAAARALYHSLGFVEAGTRRGYYADPLEDGLLLRRSLP